MNYKYYLSRNEIDSGGSEIISLYKIGEGIKEEITYIRLPDGGFNITREIHREDFAYPGGIEIQDIEFEVISGSAIDVADTFSRLLSYFDDQKIDLSTVSLPFERMEVCRTLEIPILQINTSKYPYPLLSSIPYISGRSIIVTIECMAYLRELKNALSSKDDRNSRWLCKGVEDLISYINEHYPNIRGC